MLSLFPRQWFYIFCASTYSISLVFFMPNSLWSLNCKLKCCPSKKPSLTIYFCIIDYAKAFDCVDHNKLWKILKCMGIPGRLTCFLRSLYAGQETTVRTGYRTTDWFQIGKGVCQGYLLSPWLFNVYVEYIMRNAGLEEALAGIKIARRNINNLTYADDTTLMAE